MGFLVILVVKRRIDLRGNVVADQRIELERELAIAQFANLVIHTQLQISEHLREFVLARLPRTDPLSFDMIHFCTHVSAIEFQAAAALWAACLISKPWPVGICRTDSSLSARNSSKARVAPGQSEKP